MALPANWQHATAPSGSRWLAVLVCSVCAAILTLFLLLLRFGALERPALIFWNDPNASLKFSLIVSAPYILCMVLLLVSNSYTRSLGAGVAGAAAAVFIFWEGLYLAAVVMEIPFYHSSMREPGPDPGPIVLLLFVALVCQATACTASLLLFLRKSRKVVFLGGALMTAMYAGAVYSAEQSSFAKYLKAVEDVDRESTVALKTVESISWCAIEFASKRPAQGYPASLDAISGNAICKRPWSLSDIPDYSVTYSPSRNTSGEITTFSVKAVATAAKELRAPKNAESDQSGVALIDYIDPHFTNYPTEIGTFAPLDTIWMNRICFRNYAHDHPQLGFPLKFADVPDCHGAFRQKGDSFLSESVIRSVGGEYLFTYLPSPPDRSGKVHSYELQVTCQDYGVSCLHSFVLTSSGQIFATTANHPATPRDALLPACPRRRPTTTFCLQGD